MAGHKRFVNVRQGTSDVWLQDRVPTSGTITYHYANTKSFSRLKYANLVCDRIQENITHFLDIFQNSSVRLNIFSATEIHSPVT